MATLYQPWSNNEKTLVVNVSLHLLQQKSIVHGLILSSSNENLSCMEFQRKSLLLLEGSTPRDWWHIRYTDKYFTE
jgi:hypothetical protein